VNENLSFHEAVSALRQQEPDTQAFNIWNLGGDARLAKTILPFRCGNCHAFVTLFVHRDGGCRCTDCDHTYCELKSKGWN
jgi:hypothetical protein